MPRGLLITVNEGEKAGVTFAQKVTPLMGDY